MKDFILNMGRGFIDFCACMLLITIFIVSFVLLLDKQTWWMSILVLFFGLIAEVITFYFIYLLIDIRDSIKTIADNNNKQKE